MSQSKPGRTSGGHASLASRPSAGGSSLRGGNASTIDSSPRVNSVAAAVGQKCVSEIKIPRGSITTLRGKCLHADGNAAGPRSRCTTHSRPPWRSKKTQSPRWSRFTIHFRVPSLSSDDTKRSPSTPALRTLCVRTSSTTCGSAGTLQLSQHAPAWRHWYRAWISRQNAVTSGIISGQPGQRKNFGSGSIAGPNLIADYKTEGAQPSRGSGSSMI